MKSDEDVRMISAEAPVLFAKVREQVDCVFLAHGMTDMDAWDGAWDDCHSDMGKWMSGFIQIYTVLQACEMFILELTLRSWNAAEENKRRTLQRSDVAQAITRTDIFDFLV